jgi:hypothetical protein
MRSMKIRMALLMVLLALAGCSDRAVIPMSKLSYDPAADNRIVCIEVVGNGTPIFELYGDGAIRVQRDPLGEEVKSGQLGQGQVKQLLNHIINKLRVGDLGFDYSEEFIPGIEMHPNFDLVLVISIDGFNKQISFAYSSVCDELEFFKEEGRIDKETFDELNKLRAVFKYLLGYKF